MKLARFAAVVVASGCSHAPTDLNEPCELVRAGPDGGAVPILKTDPVIADQANADIVSFGASSCSSGICVRDALYDDSADPGLTATGYCSYACGTNGPCDSAQGELDQTATTRLSCRPLLLDDAYLQALKMSDPQEYAQVFDSSPTAGFCARGGAAPGP